MSTDNTLIGTEMNEVRANGFGAHYKINVQIYANKQWLNPLKLDLYSVERDYESSFADVRIISFLLLMGTYTYDLLPYRNNIQVDVTYIPVGEAGDGQLSNKRAFTRRYRGLLMDPSDPSLTTNVSNQGNRKALDNQPPKQVEMQLIEEYIYDLQMRTVGRRYRNMTTHQALMAILTQTLEYIQGKDEKRVLGVNTIGTPNPDVQSQLIIPDGTPLGRVSSILQDDEGGVFAAGLGCYLQDQYWYVYPLYDTTHVSKKNKSITVYCVPSDRYEGSEKTYRETTNRLIILAGGDAHSLNLNENNQVAAGSGVRFLDTRKLLDGFALSSGNRMLVDKATNLFEITAKSITEGVNNIQWSAKRISSNPYVHYSAIARMDGRVVSVEWRHGDVDLLEPGALVEYFTVSEGKIEKYKGVLLGAHEQRIAAETGIAVTRHPGVVQLKLFIENKPATATGA